MEFITKQDCENLYKDFMKYCDTAEPNQFVVLFIIDMKMTQTIKNFEKISQKELRSMFRTILKIIGKDYNAYVEKE